MTVKLLLAALESGQTDHFAMARTFCIFAGFPIFRSTAPIGAALRDTLEHVPAAEGEAKEPPEEPRLDSDMLDKSTLAREELEEVGQVQS